MVIVTMASTETPSTGVPVMFEYFTTEPLVSFEAPEISDPLVG
jgi:hypothetical protein